MKRVKDSLQGCEIYAIIEGSVNTKSIDDVVIGYLPNGSAASGSQCGRQAQD